MSLCSYVKEKAQFRIGQVVTCDYYPGTLFHVKAKNWNMNGNLRYTISRTVGTDKFEDFDDYCGLRGKDLSAKRK